MINDKKFHFIAIGGVGQSALAKILLSRKYIISGSDINDSKYVKALKELGAKVVIGHDKNNVQDDMNIVLSTAIKEDNPELIRAKELNLPIFHRSDVLKLISSEYKTFIGFSGTHGKTTSSGMMSYVLEKMNVHPAYAVGGIISGLETNANAYSDSEVFVAELDESDGTIVKYSPDYIVINNLEADHFDFYKNGNEDIINTFLKFTQNLKDTSKIFLNMDDKGVLKLYEKIPHKNVITYSLKNKNANYYSLIKDGYFELYKNGEFLTNVKTSIKGYHNVTNTTSVLSVLYEIGYDEKEFLPHIYSFSGTKRRFEVLYDKDITVIDDYAHHPTEIKAVLNCAKDTGAKNITAIFQPHRYTRLKALYGEFLNSFELADVLFVVDTFSAGDKFDEKYNSENFAKTIKHKNVRYVKGDMDTAAKEIAKNLKKGDFVITIGAGDVTKIGHKLGELYEQYGN